MNAAAKTAGGWAHRGERGSMPLIRFMAWLSVKIGRGPARVLLRGIAAYFFATGGAERRATRDFLARCLGRAPTLAEQYRTFFAFAATIHDRIYFLQDRFDLFAIEVHGRELFEEGGGALLLGAHLGSFESMRSCGRSIRREVTMAMYGAHAQKITAVLSAIAPAMEQDIVELGRVQSMLELEDRFEAGALVGLLADRTFGAEPTVDVEFMGAKAAFPTGPMRMAAALRQPVIFMTSLYRGGNRYEMHFERLADFTDLEGLGRAERDARVRAGIEAYARRLEHYARAAPHNWFNFFDFWGGRR
ncbi:MAG TPA: acyl-CoA synthetase [Usitatibacter sp.]|nr:acyl-CoA synthetase [Usitatibacter sp.]